MEWNQINTSDFLFVLSTYNFISYTQSSIHLVFILNQNAFLIVRRGEWEKWHSLTDRLVQLPNWRTSPTWDTLGHGRAQVVPGRSSVTLSLCPHWSRDVVDKGPTLKIQQPAVTSRTRALTFIWEEWRYVEVQLRKKINIVKNTCVTRGHGPVHF